MLRIRQCVRTLRQTHWRLNGRRYYPRRQLKPHRGTLDVGSTGVACFRNADFLVHLGEHSNDMQNVSTLQLCKHDDVAGTAGRRRTLECPLMNHIVFFEDLLLVLFGACVLSLVASRFTLPSAAVLLIGGAAIGFATEAPVVALDPDVVMVVLIPPLLMSSAFYTAWREFRRETAPIASLALGSVVFTTACVACAVHWVDPQLPWAACVALGAIVSPPDAVAAKALLGKLPLPERLVTVLEGESLVNDASGLVIYRFAVVALTAGTLGRAMPSSPFRRFRSSASQRARSSVGQRSSCSLGSKTRIWPSC